MSASDLRMRFRELPLDDRAILLEELWQDLVRELESMDLPDAVRAELARRVERYRSGETSSRPWDEVRDEILRSL